MDMTGDLYRVTVAAVVDVLKTMRLMFPPPPPPSFPPPSSSSSAPSAHEAASGTAHMCRVDSVNLCQLCQSMHTSPSDSLKVRARVFKKTPWIVQTLQGLDVDEGTWAAPYQHYRVGVHMIMTIMTISLSFSLS